VLPDAERTVWLTQFVATMVDMVGRGGGGKNVTFRVHHTLNPEP